MLSRHFLRSKVLQLAYAAFSDPEVGYSPADAEKAYKQNISGLNDLGTLQLSMLEQFVEVAGVMIEEGRHKYMPTAEDLNPNVRILNNRVIRKLVDNYDYRKHVADAGVNWGGVEYDEIYRQAYAGLIKMGFYRNYLDGEDDFAHDQEFVLKLFKYLVNYSQLCEAIYPQNLFWEDDFDQIAQYQFKFLKGIDETFDEASVVPLVCDMRDESDAEAYDFARDLLLNTLRLRDEVEDLIRKNLQGWEFDRVAEMDILLINMAVAELTECPSIPERVTVDEYIELSKEFSSDRSRLFINGILGKFLLLLRSAGRIKKSGRGIANYDRIEEEGEESGIRDEETGTKEEEPVPVVTVRKSRPRIKNSKREPVNIDEMDTDQEV